MKMLSFIALSAFLSLSACSHHKKDCCGKKDKVSCSKEHCTKDSCGKDHKCAEGTCAKPGTDQKTCCADDHCHKKS